MCMCVSVCVRENLDGNTKSKVASRMETVGGKASLVQRTYERPLVVRGCQPREHLVQGLGFRV